MLSNKFVPIIQHTQRLLVFKCNFDRRLLSTFRVNKFSKAYSKSAMGKPDKGPRPLVICGPSGSGKSTLLKRLFKEFPDTFGFSVSHTTRKPRPGEEHGIHYHFVEKHEIKNAIDKGEFIESAEFSGNIYGTSKEAVRTVQRQGKVCVLDIEIEGVKQIRDSDLNPLLVFIMPPSIAELERRLKGRKTETPESLEKRLTTAQKEIEYGKIHGNFHVVVHNHHIPSAYQMFRDFILKELENQKSEGISVTLTRTEIDYDTIETIKERTEVKKKDVKKPGGNNNKKAGKIEKPEKSSNK